MVTVITNQSCQLLQTIVRKEFYETGPSQFLGECPWSRESFIHSIKTLKVYWSQLLNIGFRSGEQNRVLPWGSFVYWGVCGPHMVLGSETCFHISRTNAVNIPKTLSLQCSVNNNILSTLCTAYSGERTSRECLTHTRVYANTHFCVCRL